MRPVILFRRLPEAFTECPTIRARIEEWIRHADPFELVVDLGDYPDRVTFVEAEPALVPAETLRVRVALRKTPLESVYGHDRYWLVEPLDEPDARAVAAWRIVQDARAVAAKAA